MPRGLLTAENVMQGGGRGVADWPQEDIERVKNHLAKYYAKTGDAALWEGRASQTGTSPTEHLFALLSDA